MISSEEVKYYAGADIRARKLAIAIYPESYKEYFEDGCLVSVTRLDTGDTFRSHQSEINCVMSFADIVWMHEISEHEWKTLIISSTLIESIFDTDYYQSRFSNKTAAILLNQLSAEFRKELNNENQERQDTLFTRLKTH